MTEEGGDDPYQISVYNSKKKKKPNEKEISVAFRNVSSASDK